MGTRARMLKTESLILRRGAGPAAHAGVQRVKMRGNDNTNVVANVCASPGQRAEM